MTVGGLTSATSGADVFTYTAPTGVIFSDGFESGTLAAWDGTLGNGTLSPSAAAARSGGFGARLNDTASGQYSVLLKRLSSSLDDSYTRFSVRFSGMTGSPTVAYGRDDSSSAVRWILYYDARSQSFDYYIFNGAGQSSGVTASGVAPVGTWITVELRFTGTATGGGQIWVNGVTQPAWTISGNFATTAPYQRLQLWNDALGIADFDDVNVSTGQTGTPAPTVTAITPTSGPAGGGTVVTITGTGFSTTAGATTVRFGTTTASGVSCASSTSCSATSPAGSGVVDVTVTVAGMTSATSAADRFTYPGTAPMVSAVTPTSGPAAGGTIVTITGTGFSTTAGATTVRFGATAASGVSCASSTSCSATSPAGSG
ncbi:MAG: hypothetical protein E6I18_12610, partial [Chloroflexi bacterium]